MTSRKLASLVVALGVAAVAAPAQADYISPSIKDRGHEYSTEKPNHELYGTGVGGRLTESSRLRFEADFALQEKDFLKAEKLARKAVQMDPGYPDNHMLLARALTGKFYQQKGEVDEKLLHECLREWTMLRYHNADVSEQWEASAHLKRLGTISKALQADRKEKAKEEERKAKIAAKEAKKNGQTSEKVASSEAASTEKKVEEEPTAVESLQKKLAEKKKRFIMF